MELTCQENKHDEDFLRIFGNLIRQFRLENSLNQAQAASLCGLSISKWIALENGDVLPPKNTMLRICKCFDIPQDVFLQRLTGIIDRTIEQYQAPRQDESPPESATKTTSVQL